MVRANILGIVYTFWMQPAIFYKSSSLGARTIKKPKTLQEMCYVSVLVYLGHYNKIPLPRESWETKAQWDGMTWPRQGTGSQSSNFCKLILGLAHLLPPPPNCFTVPNCSSPRQFESMSITLSLEAGFPHRMILLWCPWTNSRFLLKLIKEDEHKVTHPTAIILSKRGRLLWIDFSHQIRSMIFKNPNVFLLRKQENVKQKVLLSYWKRFSSVNSYYYKSFGFKT